MTKIEWFSEEQGVGPYKHIACGCMIDITDSPYREAMLRNAERERQMTHDALSRSIFSEAGE